jgi:hypothetical protein
MNRRRRCRTIAVTLWALTVPVLAALPVRAQTVRLAPAFDPQRVNYLEFKQQVEQSLTGGKLGDETAKTHLSQTFGLLQSVDQVDADGARVRLAFDRIAQRVSSDGPLTMAYDSDRPASDQSDALLAGVYRPMLGMQLTMRVTPDGEVRDFQGMAAVLERVRQSAGSNVLYERIRTMMSDEMSRCTWGDALLVAFPNRSVRVGEQWSRSLEQPNPLTGPLTLDYEFRLEQVSTQEGRELAEVSFRGTTRPGAKLAGPSDCTICYELEHGAFEGRATIDVARGECVRQVETGEVTLKMTVPDARSPEPARMSLTQKSRSTFRCVPAAVREKERDAAPLQFNAKP